MKAGAAGVAGAVGAKGANAVNVLERDGMVCSPPSPSEVLRSVLLRTLREAEQGLRARLVDGSAVATVLQDVTRPGRLKLNVSVDMDVDVDANGANDANDAAGR